MPSPILRPSHGERDVVVDALVGFVAADQAGQPSTSEGSERARSEALQRLQLALVSCHAGSVAWARHRKRSVASCDGHQRAADVARAGVVVDAFARQWVCPEGWDALARTSAIAHATGLIRTPAAWSAVRSLANRLWGFMHLSEDEIDERCRKACGPRPIDRMWEACRPAEFRGAAYDALVIARQPLAASAYRARDGRAHEAALTM